MQQLRFNFRPLVFAAFAVLAFAPAGRVALWGQAGSSAVSRAKSEKSTPAPSRTPSPGSAATQQAAFVKRYCVGCHNAQMQSGGLAFDKIDFNNIQAHGEVLERMYRQVWTGSMPPPKMPRADKAGMSAFLTSLQASLDHNAVEHPFAGRPTMLHRLNRNEYMAAIHDLLNITLTPDDAAMLPADDLSYGFDNNGDVLGLPPLLLERYLSVARRASIMAVGSVRGDAPLAVYTHTLEFGPSQNRWNEGLPLGTRGGTSFSYRFPRRRRIFDPHQTAAAEWPHRGLRRQPTDGRPTGPASTPT